MTPEQLREIEFWLDQHTAARDGLDQRTVAAILAMYVGVNFYDRLAVEEVAEAAAETSDTAAILAAGLMAQYLATVTSTTVGEDLPTPAVLLPPLRNGADMRLIYQRPIKLFRRQVAKGVQPAEAYRQAMHAAATLTETNNTLAMRQASQIALSQLATEANITGFRRILRPELAKTGISCGLCIAASDQVYNKARLLPMHGGCNCDVLPIVGAAGGTGDPGNSLNNLDLGDLYAAAGSTDGWDLKRTRFEVNEHGELGPVLTVEGHKFTGPDDLALAS